ncbi:phosphate ABC transporter permease PstA [Haloferula chungangensis]|uniref:Phosphate transport system permease protein PstA n=1 Tax=Haloferula chungangensis TaxID=1048331 RepID=A0ABW2LCL5_9BACT
MADSTHSFATTGRSRKGEPLVWLTAAGLAIGVILTLSLLSLVVVKGMESFWPKRLVIVDVEKDGVQEKVGGYIAQERERRDMAGVYHEEIQVFRGNRDLYGETFVYIDRADIKGTSEPDDLLVVERLEGGSAIGRAVAFEFGNGERLEAGTADFMARVEAELEASRKLRDELEGIEKEEIGRNSEQVKKLKNEERLHGENEEILAELTELQTKYAKLDEKRLEIRERLEADHLVMETADGRELRVSSGELLHVFAPNKVGVFGRAGEMLRRIWSFLSSNPREANMEGGVYPAIFGTVVMTLVMSLFVTPFGVIAAIYLREYAKQGPLVQAVRISVNNLAGVPSIVFGVFGLAFFIYFVGGVVDDWFYSDLEEPVFKSGGILWASLTLALLTVPVVIVATEEALAAVPRGVREAALACGASKWQTIQRVVLPASVPGILTGVILAMARGAGEVAPLMLVGVVKSAPDLPVDSVAPFVHAERQFMHLGFHIYDLGFQSPDSEAAKPMVFATTLLLITIVVVMNLAAIMIRNHLRKKYATSSF